MTNSKTPENWILKRKQNKMNWQEGRRHFLRHGNEMKWNFIFFADNDEKKIKFNSLE